jgi:hypothetical protein
MSMLYGGVILNVSGPLRIFIFFKVFIVLRITRRHSSKFLEQVFLVSLGEFALVQHQISVAYLTDLELDKERNEKDSLKRKEAKENGN